MPTSTRLATCLSVVLIALPILSNLLPAHAARIKWCMRVVPSGETVIRYGENRCRS